MEKNFGTANHRDSIRLKNMKLLKKFLYALRQEGLRSTVRKTVFFMKRRLSVAISCNPEREFPADYEILISRFPQLGASITSHRCKGIFIMGSQCMGWNEVFKQRHHHIAEYLLADDYVVLCAMNPHYEKDVTPLIREERENLYLVNFDERTVWKDIIDFIALHSAKPVYYHLVGTEPGTTPQDIAYLQSLNIHIVYDYFDEVSTVIFPGLSEMSRQRHTLLLSDSKVLVVTTADKLYRHALEFKRENVILSTNGVRLEDWMVADNAPVPLEMEEAVSRQKPIIGFYGSFAPWLDYACIKKLALERPDYTIVMIGYDYEWGKGSFAQSGIAELPNVYIIPAQRYDALKFFSRHFDVGIVPFRAFGLSDSVSPVKMFEYMAQGLPVVATGLPEARKYASVFNASGEDEFVRTVDRALSLKGDSTYQTLLRTDAENNTWASRGEQVKSAMESMPSLPLEEPVLTIGIPTYNMAALLPRCLDSLLLPATAKLLDICIINDGSSDDSLAVAERYAAEYPMNIRVFDKENGGHGSCINTGIAAAKGRYFKLVDSDDWLDPVALLQHVCLLAGTDADMVVTDYKQAFAAGGTNPITYAERLEERVYSRDELLSALMLDDETTAYVHMHAVTYKTALLRGNGVRVTEKSFYVDQEYIAYPLSFVATAEYQRIFLYRYLIGRADQSVSPEMAKKRSPQCYQILKKIITFLEQQSEGTVLFDYVQMLAYHQAYFFLEYAENEIWKQEVYGYFSQKSPAFKEKLGVLM